MRATKDLLAGLFFMAIGFGAVITSTSYEIGTAMQMGPGYFPALLGGMIALLGLVLAGRALLSPKTSEPLDRWKLRPLFFVLAAVLAFSLLIDSGGLMVAIAMLTLFVRLAGREGGILEFVVMLIVLCAIAAGIFVYGLNIPLRLIPW